MRTRSRRAGNITRVIWDQNGLEDSFIALLQKGIEGTLKTELDKHSCEEQEQLG
jgi:hypothetical protein